MNDDLIIQDALFQCSNGKYFLCKALYKSEPCFCIQKRENGITYSALFDYNERICRSVISKMKRERFRKDTKKSGSGFMFRFDNTSGKGGISLRLFLWGKYNSIPPQKVKKAKIELNDRSAYTDNIMDMRSHNLYNAGGTVTDGIAVVKDPATDRQYIIVQDGDRIEFLDYSPEMYLMLTTRNICAKCKCNTSRDNGRLFTSVHYSCKKDGWKICNLSRFVLYYVEFFDKFKRYRTGSITRFIHNIPSFVPDKNIECGHINAHSWNNCKENIMFMEKEKNDKMSTYARIIQGRYKMFPIAYRENGQVKILIEWSVGEHTKFIVCKNEDDYMNLQESALGKIPLTANLEMRFAIVNEDGEQEVVGTIPTPISQAAPAKEKAEVLDRKDTIRAMLNWSSRKDSLIALYREHPNFFYPWKNTNPSHDNPITIEDLIKQAVLLFV